MLRIEEEIFASNIQEPVENLEVNNAQQLSEVDQQIEDRQKIPQIITETKDVKKEVNQVETIADEIQDQPIPLDNVQNPIIFENGLENAAENIEVPLTKGLLKSVLINQSKNAKCLNEVMIERLKKVKSLLKPNAACDQRVLKAFGVKNPTYAEPTPANADELGFCRRNRNTCCTASNFEDGIQRFTENAKKFLRAFQPVEELITILKGDAYNTLYANVKTKPECQHITKDIIDPSGASQIYFYEKYTQIKLDEATGLLNEIEVFLKREIWFHANIMCSICNPNENPFFILKDGRAEIKSLMNTCSDILEGFEFEIRLADLYNSFFKIIAELVKCHNNIPATKAPVIEPIDTVKLEALETKFQVCLNNFKETEPACQEICSKKLSKYAPNIEFFTPYRNALILIFQQFVTDGDIYKYYEKTYEKSFPTSDPIDITFYSEKTQEWTEFNMENISWTFGSDGINVYNAQISKKFIKVSTAEVY